MNFSFSCLALNDLIRGRQADDLIDHLAEIWETLFRVLDDIKVGRKSLDISVSFIDVAQRFEFVHCF